MQSFIEAMQLGAEFLLLYFATMAVAMALTALIMGVTGHEFD